VGSTSYTSSPQGNERGRRILIFYEYGLRRRSDMFCYPDQQMHDINNVLYT